VCLSIGQHAADDLVFAGTGVRNANFAMKSIQLLELLELEEWLGEKCGSSKVSKNCTCRIIAGS
jgi:hypothetical protein